MIRLAKKLVVLEFRIWRSLLFWVIRRKPGVTARAPGRSRMQGSLHR